MLYFFLKALYVLLELGIYRQDYLRIQSQKEIKYAYFEASSLDIRTVIIR